MQLPSARSASILGIALAIAMAVARCSEDGPSLQDLSDRAEASTQDVTAAVTYRVSFGDNTSQATVKQKPPNRRFDSVQEVGDQSGTSSWITTETAQYLCVEPPNVEGICLEGNADSDIFITDFLGFFFDLRTALANKPRDFELVDMAPRRIAGLDADCFSVIPQEAGKSEAEICLSQENILLLLRSGEGDEEGLIEATAVSTNVADEDFAPPYPIVDE